MSNIDFVELATFCANRAKETRSNWGGKYERTHYVSILDDNTVKYSMTPHVLRNAHQCILMTLALVIISLPKSLTTLSIASYNFIIY